MGNENRTFRIHQVKLSLGESKDAIPTKITRMLGMKNLKIDNWEIVRESLDARKKANICWVYSVDFSVLPYDIEKKLSSNMSKYKLEEAVKSDYVLPKTEVGSAELEDRPVVVGFGPGGMLAGLILAQAGYAPIILERGSDVDTRTKQVEEFWRDGVLDVNSNVQFGEGGAGTFSDGKLTTGIKDQRIRKVLEELVKAGAPDDILYKQKPHVGTDVLRSVVKNIRQEIISLGGTVLFNKRVDTIILEGSQIKGIMVKTTATNREEQAREQDEEIIPCQAAIFAIGHSARDTFRELNRKGVVMNPKPFSLGVRIQHPQELIDCSQYGAPAQVLGLPPAEYKINHRCDNGRGVYSFCMCPGGEVIVASSQEKAVTTNGMSYHKRDSGLANSALLCDVRPEDFGSNHPLGGVDFQEKYERLAFINGGENYKPPTATWGELRDGKAPHVEKTLPPFVVEAFKEAMPHLGRKLQGFDRDDSMIFAVEARSSSPVRFERNERLEGAMYLRDGSKTVLEGLYPCGEGAGFAGGIMSAAVDGIRAAESIIKNYSK